MRSAFLVALVVLAIALPTLPTSVYAGNINVREMIKQIVPRVAPQLRKISAVAGKVAVTAVCIVSVCAISFATPADTTDIDDLNSNVEALGHVGSSLTSSVVEVPIDTQHELTFNHWLAKGIYHNSGDNVGVMRFGVTAERGNLAAFLTVAFRYGLDNGGIDDIAIKTRTWGGIKGTLIDNGARQLSYGYNSVELSTSKHLRLYSTQNYLLSYRIGSLHISGLGYEYVDTEGKKLSGDEGADNVRSHGAALYRANIKYPLTFLFSDSDATAIDLKLNSTLHLGDIGFATLGETWQDELNAWIGESADLHHTLYHRAGGNIKIKLADEQVSITLGGEIHHTVGGKITYPNAEDGDFDLNYRILSVAGDFIIIPSQDISLFASFGRYDQSVNAQLGEETYKQDSWGTSGRFLLKKKF